MIWKCHLRTPVFASRHTSDSANRFAPGRRPPKKSLLGVLTGRYTRPRAASSDIGAHPLVWPVNFHDRSCHVSFPTSPACGIVWNVHTCLPVRASNARTSPGGSFLYTRRSPTPLPRITRSLYTIGGDVLV